MLSGLRYCTTTMARRTESSSSRHYPNLAPCRIVLQSSTSSKRRRKPPVRLPADVMDNSKHPSPPPACYDFALGALRCVIVESYCIVVWISTTLQSYPNNLSVISPQQLHRLHILLLKK